ncbi:DUF4352 domain-containing protein [Streptomyces sp. NPDC002122]|uniref:DUF4352 domain-containing protein n=1 Tax=Streptomyces sp. NPDC002122 TaxID=3154407 RepID=UPI003323C80A
MADGSTPGRNSHGWGEPPAGPPSGPLNGPPPDPTPPRKQTLLLVLIGGIVLVFGVVGILAAAGAFEKDGPGGATDSPTPSAPRASASTPLAAPTPPASAGRTPGTPSAAGVLAFGATQRYDDGVEVTVSAPDRFTPSEAAAGHKAGYTAVTVQVTVRNGSDERLELALLQVSARDGDGREATRIFDVEPDLGSGLTGALLPGRKAVAVYGFDVPPGKGATLDVEVRIGFQTPSAFWGGTL